ncbi:Ku protein [Pelagicoccus sp. SDUM812005]|uniref:non-homologous end joining protein Ku n=1 Tax=Pelagicoccus sp. SDUM812005 TaxID=3041257 RepID=UPI00280D6A93|nr:Ku protein [Pelagicoccus sp. SDUM812005]MDQ8183286.1 Ku protein [Pelagicoccus sp. SDUM812005]
MARAIWKGSISFGLVNIPVALFSAEQRSDIQFRMIDSRNNARVRYERINESSGEEVPWNSVVKGYEYEDDKYVLLSDEEMAKVSPEATKTIDIEDFISLEEIDPLYFDKPYYLEPAKHGEKSYLLLARSLEASGKAGIARVVIRSRQHLCAILSRNGHLVIELLRFPQELRDLNDYQIPDDSLKRNKLTKREVDLAIQLIESMTLEWDPGRYRDEYSDKLLDWINEKISEGHLSTAPDLVDEDDDNDSAEVVDLMDYLKRSVASRENEGTDGKKKAKKTTKKATKKTAKKTTRKTAKKRPSASRKKAS